MAPDCISIARKMSLKSDRIRMEEMAKRWLDLATEAEGTRFTHVSSSLIPQPTVAQQSKLSDDEQS